MYKITATYILMLTGSGILYWIKKSMSDGVYRRHWQVQDINIKMMIIFQHQIHIFFWLVVLRRLLFFVILSILSELILVKIRQMTSTLKTPEWFYINAETKGLINLKSS